MRGRMHNRSAPKATVVPMLMYEDVASAISWLIDAFGAKESLRYSEPDGRVTHAQIMINGHEIMLGWPGPNYQCPKRHGHICQSVLVHVENVDAHFKHAKMTGADIASNPETQPFGERSYEAIDPEGHHWYFSEHVSDVAPESWGATQCQ
jgi:uncharacterized glyoxalase superfamily protein PhnB